jgi:hypothetical protein
MASTWSEESNMNVVHRMLRGLQDTEAPTATKHEADLVAELYSQDAVASKMSMFAKISVGLAFMVLLFFILGTFQ